MNVYNMSYMFLNSIGVVRWCWVTSSAVRLTNVNYSRARAYCACSGAGGGCFDIFFSRLSFHFSFSLSLGDGPI